MDTPHDIRPKLRGSYLLLVALAAATAACWWWASEQQTVLPQGLTYPLAAVFVAALVGLAMARQKPGTNQAMALPIAAVGLASILSGIHATTQVLVAMVPTVGLVVVAWLSYKVAWLNYKVAWLNYKVAWLNYKTVQYPPNAGGKKNPASHQGEGSDVGIQQREDPTRASARKRHSTRHAHKQRG